MFYYLEDEKTGEDKTGTAPDGSPRKGMEKDVVEEEVEKEPQEVTEKDGGTGKSETKNQVQILLFKVITLSTGLFICKFYVVLLM